MSKVGWTASLLNDLRATARSAAFENEAGCTEAEVSYAPFPIWIWLNGDEWAKRQLEKARVGYETLDNGFRACTDPALLEKICDRLGPREIRDFFWRWFARLPCPLTQADVRAGYGYAWAFRQYEVSETCVFDRPQAGRMWFEGVICDHLDIGRPDQVALIFHRRVNRCTGLFRTRVLTKGVDPTCVAITSPRGSSSIAKGDGHYGPRPSSATRMILESEVAFALRTGRP